MLHGAIRELGEHFPAQPVLAHTSPNTRAASPAGQLPGKVRTTLMLDGAMRELAERLRDSHSLLFFGRGYNYATALEAALKVGDKGGGCDHGVAVSTLAWAHW